MLLPMQGTTQRRLRDVLGRRSHVCGRPTLRQAILLGVWNIGTTLRLSGRHDAARPAAAFVRLHVDRLHQSLSILWTEELQAFLHLAVIALSSRTKCTSYQSHLSATLGVITKNRQI